MHLWKLSYGLVYKASYRLTDQPEKRSLLVDFNSYFMFVWVANPNSQRLRINI
jgi:hypothetical protein